MTVAAMPTAKELQDRLDKAEAQLTALRTPDAVTKQGDTVDSKTKGYTPKPSDVFGNPTARKGESVMTSRGWRIGRALQAMVTKNWDHAKVELDIHNRLASAFGGGCGGASFEPGTTLAPFGTALLPEEMANDQDFGVRMKSLFHAGVEGADPDEMRWLVQKHYTGGTRKDLSWLDSSAGGAMVGPPERGEFVELLRNRAALTEAGVTIIPLPPTGRLQYPKQTSATTGYWIGESQPMTASQPGTGLITLSAKKCAGLTKIPNELIRFAGAAAEALVRGDLATTLALTIDLAGIEGTGGDTKPLGIINTPGVQTITPTTAASGNTGAILGEGDIYSFPSAIEEANGQFESFLTVPSMYYALLKRRVDAVTAADGKGAFAFSPFRALGDAVNQKNINGYKVTTSNQAPKNRVQGSSTNNTVLIGGQFSACLLAMFGAMEFALGTQGDTPFVYDQTWVRAIAIADFGIKWPGTLAWIDKLQRI